MACAASSAGAGSKPRGRARRRSDGGAAGKPFAAALERGTEALDQLDQSQLGERGARPVAAERLRLRREARLDLIGRPARAHRARAQPSAGSGSARSASACNARRASEGAENGSGRLRPGRRGLNSCLDSARGSGGRGWNSCVKVIGGSSSGSAASGAVPASGSSASAESSKASESSNGSSAARARRGGSSKAGAWSSSSWPGSGAM